MTIKQQTSGSNATVAPEGRIDTVTAPDLEAVLAKMPEGVTALTLDFQGVDYISSAGLRVLLTAQKRLSGVGGTMVVANIRDVVREVFDITGFSDILTLA